MKLFEWLAATRNNQALHSHATRKFLGDYRASVIAKVGTTNNYLKQCKYRGAIGEEMVKRFEEATKNDLLIVPGIEGTQDFRINQIGRDLM